MFVLTNNERTRGVRSLDPGLGRGEMIVEPIFKSPPRPKKCDEETALQRENA